LRSFSKITFPGLRVGWVLGPRALIARLAQSKQLADLHTDQLSQAVLLRFAESGRMAAHRAHMLQAGAERLAAVLAACDRYLPAGSRFTRPRGGMNLWVRRRIAGPRAPRERLVLARQVFRGFALRSRIAASELRRPHAGRDPQRPGDFGYDFFKRAGEDAVECRDGTRSCNGVGQASGLSMVR